MFTSIRDKAKNLLNPSNKDPLSRIFQNPEYLQDSAERHAQILFFKLMMMIAYLDEEVDAEELNLLKDYAYEHCLNESEWREVSYYELRKASTEEIHGAIDALIGEIRGKLEKQEFLSAVQEMIDADTLTGSEERQILEAVKSRIESHDVSLLGNLVRGIKKRLHAAEREYSGQSDSNDYSTNPVAPFIRQFTGKNDSAADTVAAKLGIAILLIHSDAHFHEKELLAFKELVRQETRLSDEQSNKLADQIIKIPDNHFELTRLSRIIAESLGEAERKAFLEKMFQLARADNIFEILEENYLRIITSALMLSHKDFIQAKLKTA